MYTNKLNKHGTNIIQIQNDENCGVTRNLV